MVLVQMKKKNTFVSYVFIAGRDWSDEHIKQHMMRKGVKNAEMYFQSHRINLFDGDLDVTHGDIFERIG